MGFRSSLFALQSEQFARQRIRQNRLWQIRVLENEVRYMAQNYIFFDRPAENWHQGCPLGNGFMGQMLYGGIRNEQIDLSHLTFFSGSDRVNPYSDHAAEAFYRARQAAADGDHEAAWRHLEGFMGRRGNYGTNLPVGRLDLSFSDSQMERSKEEEKSGQPGMFCRKETARVREGSYRRRLDLDSGLFSCSFDTSFGHQKREAFSSHPDRVFAYRIEDDSPEGISLTLTFDGGRNPYRTYVENDCLCFDVQALETKHSDGTEGVKLFGAVRICAEGGTVKSGIAVSEPAQAYLTVRGASRVLLLLAMETDYAPKAGMECPIDRNQVFLRINHTIPKYRRLKETHTCDINKLMKRQRLQLVRGEEPEAEMTGEQMVEAVRQGGDNRRLTQLMYQYGRYLLLSSSREDSPLPTPLQGVWNDDVACQIGWTCDMHLDINTQMNYWISEPGNLSECHKPLFRWMENRLIPLGRETARRCYGLDGWVGELVSNAWGYAAPYWGRSLSPCPTGGIWQASDYMEHYRYGQDREFLRRHALPVLEEAVRFFLSYLFEDENGYLTSGPSISPENVFLADGVRLFASNGCTYEILMIRELFLEYAELCEELLQAETKEGRSQAEPEEGMSQAKSEETLPQADVEEERSDMENGETVNRENELLRRVQEALPRLLPYRILPDGTLAEWSHDYRSEDPQHRHTSHLLGLFPYSQITPKKTPELARAAAASIEAKLTPFENWEDTGWARSLLFLYRARLEDRKEAFRHLRDMQTILTGPNLMVMHPPTRGTATELPVYELDGNTGLAMGVMESLIQSHDGCIRLLPALPESWPDGSVTGVVVRGGILLDLTWKNGVPVCVEAVSGKDQEVRVSFGNQEQLVCLKAGEKTVFPSFD